MKKSIKAVISILIVLGLLVACGGSSTSGKSAKIGVASNQIVAETKEAEKIEFDTVVAGVSLVDDKLVYVNIDISQQFAVEENETITAMAMLTKKQLGEDYGMKGASEATGLGKEWYEQIEGVEEGLIGKTFEEAKAYFAGDEILTAATISLSDIEATVLKAIENAVEVKDVSQVSLGHNVVVSTTADDTKVSSTLEYAMIAVDAEGNIVKALLDTAEEKAELDGTTWNLVNVNKTKGELKEEYGMIVASGIEKEWYEQNDALMEYLVGKNLDDVANLNDNPGEEEDLKTSVTFGISGIKAAIKNAKDTLVSID